MAVSPLRALLCAHLQSTWNRTVNDMGKRSGLALYLGVAVLVMVLLVPVTLGSLFIGQSLGHSMLDSGLKPHADSTAGFILGMALMAMLPMGSLFGGDRVLPWEASRLFPVGLRTLFLAELVADLGDLIPIIFVAIFSGLLLGIGLAKPMLLLILPMPWLGCLATLLCLRQLSSSLQIRFAKRLKLGLIILALLGGFVSLPALDPELAQAFHFVPQKLTRFLELLPTIQCARGLEDAMAGRWTLAILRQSPFLALALALAIPAALLMKQEADPQHLQTNAKPRKEKLWSFRDPAWGMARLHLQTIWNLPMAKLNFVLPALLPLFMLAPMKLGHMQNSHSPWGLLMVFTMQGSMMSGLSFNQFGMDGPGIKALLLLPIHSRDLLKGKFLGLACLAGWHALVFLGSLGALGILKPALMPSALCLMVCMFIGQAGLGHWISAWRPLRVNMAKPTQSQRPGLAWALTINSILLAQMIFLCIPYMLLVQFALAWALPVMAMLALFLIFLYAQINLPRAAIYLEQRKEELVKVLG